MNLLCSIDSSSLLTNSFESPLLSGSAKVNGGSYFSSPNTLAFGVDKLTVEMWVKLASYTGSQNKNGLFGTGNSATNSIQLYIEYTGEVTAEIVNVSAMSTTTKVPLNVWTHVAFTRNVSTYKIFINGVKSAEKVIGTSGTNLNIAGYGIAAWSNNGGNKLTANSLLTGVRISNVDRYASVASFVPSKDKIITGSGYFVCCNMSQTDFIPTFSLAIYPSGTGYSNLTRNGTIVYDTAVP